MHTASSFASGFTSTAYSQSICQTTSFIGSVASGGNCRSEAGVPTFTEELVPLLQLPAIPVYPVPTQMPGVAATAGAGCSMHGGQGGSADSLMQLLQGLESEIVQLSGSLSSASSQGTSCSSGLHGDYATLYGEAVSAVQDGSSFGVKLPSGETLSGKFSWSELEVAGSNSLFTPGNASAPDAGKQAFENSLEQFLELAQSDSAGGSAAGQIANYNTDTSFTSTSASISWTGSFSLAPADAIPKG